MFCNHLNKKELQELHNEFLDSMKHFFESYLCNIASKYKN